MQLRQLGLFLASVMLAGSALADTLSLREGHPQHYVVQRGDTLWDISGRFLSSPWQWPRLWQQNRQIANPHLIYPGDRLTLVWVDGQPRLVTDTKPVVKLSPRVRREVRPEPVPTLDLAAIGPFLRTDHIFEPDLPLAELPYVLGDNDLHLGMLEGQVLHVRGQLTPGARYGIYRPGTLYRDPSSGEELGRQAVLVGVVAPLSLYQKDQASVRLLSSFREVKQGDRLLPLPEQERLDAYFVPRAGQLTTPGRVVALPNQMSGAGKYEVVLLDKGARDHLAPGDVLAARRPGVEILDSGPEHVRYRSLGSLGDRMLGGKPRSLPAEVAGELMVFKVYERMSLALVLTSSEMVRLGYPVGTP